MAKQVPENDIPEVMAFLEAKDSLQQLREDHPQVFEALDSLVMDYNTLLEAADKVVKAKGVSCGPFHLISSSNSYDPEKLYDSLGHERFLEVGGKMTTVTQYEVDKAKLEAFIAAGTLDKATLEEVRTITPRYKKPKKIEGL